MELGTATPVEQLWNSRSTRTDDRANLASPRPSAEHETKSQKPPAGLMNRSPPATSAPNLDVPFLGTSSPSSPSAPPGVSKGHCECDYVFTASDTEPPRHSLQICKPFFPDKDCGQKGPGEEAPLRMLGLGNGGWLRGLCCAAEEIPGGSVLVENLSLNEDIKTHSAQNGSRRPNRVRVSDVQASGGIGRRELSMPAIPPSRDTDLVALQMNDFQEDKEREYTEVEIETESMAYKGEWQGRMKHGEGVLKMPDGRIYEGQFVRDVAHGRGTLFTTNGALLECDWVQGKAEGFGHYEYRGNTYEGQWHQDEKSGSGTEHWPDGSSYVGEFSGNLRHGLGTYISNTGAKYEGEFRDDRIDGSGKYTFPDGHVYQGEWVRGHQWGNGVIEWPNGFKYEGSFENDKKSGEGVATWPNGRAYRGQWLRGQQHGRGICVHADGFEEETEWTHGKRTTTSEASSRGTPQRSGKGFQQMFEVLSFQQWSPPPSVDAQSNYSDISPSTHHSSPRNRASPRSCGKGAPAPRNGHSYHRAP